MALLATLFTAAAVLFVYMTALFLVALGRKDNSIADVAWGPGFILAAWVTLIFYGSFSARQWVANVLVLCWGLRLAVRIHLRNRGKGEDERYRKWREEWGSSFVIRSYLQVFLLQGAILLLNVTPVLFINTFTAGPLNRLDLLGAAVWLAGFALESVADRQLDRFVADPANRGKDHGQGPLAVLAAPQLLRRSHDVVGSLPRGPVGALGMGLHHRAADHHLHHSLRFRRPHDGAVHGEKSRLRRLQETHQRLCPLVPPGRLKPLGRRDREGVSAVRTTE
jgi:hypothetical protein